MEAPRAGWRDTVIIMVVLGSIWGLIEVLLGGAMKAASIPYKGDLMTGLGIGAMAVGIALVRKPVALLGIALVAVALKQLAVPILHMPFMCKANSCLAVFLGGAALAASSALAGRRLARGPLPQAATGMAAGLAAATGFYVIGMHVAPCKYLLSFNRPGGFVAFMGAEGLIWTALGGVFLPVGYRLGLGLNDGIHGLRLRRPVVYYTALGAITATAWVVSGLAIAAGL